jgi:protein ImuB
VEQALSIYLPQWDIQLHKRRSPRPHDAAPGVAEDARAARPLLLTRTTARLETVARCCAMARALGVTPGMSLADARAACGVEEGGVDVAPLDPDQSLHALHRLARWMVRFSPVVAIDPVAREPGEPPDGLLLDMTGAAHLFGGEQLLLTEIATRLARRGMASRLAIAPTIGAAWALARFGPEALTIVHISTQRTPRHRGSQRCCNEPRREEIEDATNPLDILPVEALRLAREIVEQLHSVGIETIGQLRILPRESLLHRFGAPVLLRLDQALGRTPELLVPLRHYEPVSVTQPFDGPTLSLEGIFLRLQEMLGQLTELLLHQEAGIRGLRLHWVRLNAPAITRDLVTATATRDAKHLWNLLRPKVETMPMGYGVEAMTLTAFWMQTMPHRQTGIWQADHADEDRALGEFLDTVVNRWEGRGVLRAAPAASHVPEEAWAFAPCGDTSTPASVLALDRPTVLLEEAEGIEVVALQPDRPPVRVQWRGRWEEVVRASGPERIMTPWWRVPPLPVRSVTRDYYKVETAAGWLGIFRQADRWFLYGLWS